MTKPKDYSQFFTPEIMATIRDLAARDYSYRQIAASIDVTVSRLVGVCTARGIKARREAQTRAEREAVRCERGRKDAMPPGLRFEDHPRGDSDRPGRQRQPERADYSLMGCGTAMCTKGV